MQSSESASKVPAQSAGSKQLITSSTPCNPENPYPHESFYAFISSPIDAQLAAEAAVRKLVKPFMGCNVEMNNIAVRSGSVIVFPENSVKRWKDGEMWSPSRAYGPFLLYRQMEDAPSTKLSIGTSRSPSPYTIPWSKMRRGSTIAGVEPIYNNAHLNAKNRRIKETGLTKRTITIRASDGQSYRIICYYRLQDVAGNQKLLPVPSKMPLFRELLEKDSSNEIRKLLSLSLNETKLTWKVEKKGASQTTMAATAAEEDNRYLRHLSDVSSSHQILPLMLTGAPHFFHPAQSPAQPTYQPYPAYSYAYPPYVYYPYHIPYSHSYF
ncbi:Gti1/Pac2 family-domain-containing protein [Chytriomyces sp. MP71]|nr:Gti1/Pac2 family-domain-containing protein [Chytriomyces sp. MP71]